MPVPVILQIQYGRKRVGVYISRTLAVGEAVWGSLVSDPDEGGVDPSAKGGAWARAGDELRDPVEEDREPVDEPRWGERGFLSLA